MSGAAGRLAGKVAVVTGAGSEGDWYGTGAATAVAMAECGARVAVVDLSRPRAGATAAVIESAGGVAMPVVADVTAGEDCMRAAETAAERFGPVTVLVNNLGAAVPGSVTEVDEDSWNRALALNLTSVMLMSRAVVPQMAAAGGGPIGAPAGEEMRDLRRRAGLLGTEGDAFDVAWAAVFLASGQSRYITAALLPVDAGATAVMPLAMWPHLA